VGRSLITSLGSQDLPAPDPALSGWPWTEEGADFPASRPGGQAWPRISVVTPSLNQGEFLEQTIRSVLLQHYPNLEYIIIDGGSTDGSLEIIDSYSKYLAYDICEPDRGYVHAINKGFEIATGEILCWLNSDDFYLPNTLRTIAEHLSANKGQVAIVGHVLKTYADGRPSQMIRGHYSDLYRLLKFWRGYEMHQPSIFWRREVFESIGYLNEERDLIADFDYWVRIGRHFQFLNIDQVLSCATDHALAKTADGCRRYHQELRRHARSYWGPPLTPRYWLLSASMFSSFYLRPLIHRGISPLGYCYHLISAQLGNWLMRTSRNA